MIFRETRLSGAFVVEPERIADERGFFARAFCQEEFERRGLNGRVVQCNVSFNARQGTVRGMHYQIAPHAEAKLIRCTRGAIHDVIVDLRPTSPTVRQWVATELSAENGFLLFVPEGFAHGFQTLVDNTEVFYQMSESFHPGSARGVRWDDPALAIRWPLPVQCIGAKDQTYPLLDASAES